MQAHLQRHHLNIDKSSTRKKPQKQETFPTDFRMKLQANSDRAQTINVTKSICVFMALDMRPFSVVENDGFTHLLSVLEPRYQLPSRPHFSQNVLPHLYSEVRAKLVKDLSNAKFIALTTDGWTSRVTQSMKVILRLKDLHAYGKICESVHKTASANTICKRKRSFATV